MNILPIIPNLQNKNFITGNKNLNNSAVIQPKLAQALQKDTVSFSGHSPKVSSTSISDILEQSYTSNLGQYLTEVKKFHGALKRVAKKLENMGFSFDEEYNNKHPVKSLEAYLDKCMRSGSAPDKMRATIYWQNQHDIEGFKEFIKLMDAEGYEIAKIKNKNPITKRTETLPDLEIRQHDITPDDLKILGTFLSKAEISKPRSSTYADYQMRFTPKNKKNVLIELIMLYGPHYAKAKELESDYVYNIARAFDRLHINLNQNFVEKSPGRRIANNIDVVKTRLREDISRPLFTNAYNTENRIKEPKVPAVISKIHCEMLNGYMDGIRQNIPLYYRNLKKEIKNDEFVINRIKNSTSYQVRENKTITDEDIKAARERIKRLIPQYEAEDIGVIATAKELLKATIAKFGEK